MKIISGKVIAAERLLSDFNNKKAYHANGQKVSVNFLLDDGMVYWSDNHVDDFKVGSYVEFYGGKGYNNIYLNQDTAKVLIKRKRMNIIERYIPLAANVLGIMITYAGGKISEHPVSTELVLGLCITFMVLFFMAREDYRISNEPRGEDVRKLKEYAKGYNQEKCFLNTEDINQTSSMIKEKEIYYKDK